MRIPSWIKAAVFGASVALMAPAVLAQSKTGLSFETGFAPAQDVSVWPLEISKATPGCAARWSV